jgi:hypothetical protein
LAFENILSVKIENKNQIELNQLASSLNALSAQYDSFLRKSNTDYTKNDRKLYISELKQGSIIIELFSSIAACTTDFNAIFEFFNYLKDSFDWLLERGKQKFKYSKSDLEQLGEFINPIARDSGSVINIQISNSGSGDVTSNIFIDHLQANAAQNIASKKLEDMREEKRKIFNKEFMYWASADFYDQKNKTSDKVIIENIDKKAKVAIFLDENDKKTATSRNKKFPEKNWQDLIYVVDVEISYIQDCPKAYKILKLYENDTFDPSSV